MNSKKNKNYDPTRTLQLLWGTQTKPGRSGITLKDIIEAGIKIADHNGLAMLSMRKIAEQLNVGTMSLYTYVPGKDELIDLMTDAAHANLYDKRFTPSAQGNWQTGIRIIAHKNWELFQKHAWLVELGSHRPVLGPHTMLKYETELQVLDNIGLNDIEMDSVLTLIISHIENCARTALGMISAKKDSGIDDQEWWLGYAPTLEKQMDPQVFPLAIRVGGATGTKHQSHTDPAYIYRFGLDLIIDGVSALIQNNQK